MRIIAGDLRGKKLVSPEGYDVRPTTDRVRENIFNILENNILPKFLGKKLDDITLLDAFAGSGAVGIEALSRGAARVFFIEQSKEACKILSKNLNHEFLRGRYSLIEGDALNLKFAKEPVDIAFLDPPYAEGLAELCIEELANKGWISTETLLIIETSARARPPLEEEKYTILDERKYGKTVVVFLFF